MKLYALSDSFFRTKHQFNNLNIAEFREHYLKHGEFVRRFLKQKIFVIKYIVVKYSSLQMYQELKLQMYQECH